MGHGHMDMISQDTHTEKFEKLRTYFKKLSNTQNMTTVCLSFLDSLFDQICKKRERIPVTIRIMLKLRVGMYRYGADAKAFTEIPIFEAQNTVFDREDIQEATAIAQLLVGVWFSTLFRNPILMLSNSNKNVNPAVMWCANMIFEHLMSLEMIDRVKYNKLSCLDFNMVNQWLNEKHHQVAELYNYFMNVETSDLYRSAI